MSSKTITITNRSYFGDRAPGCSADFGDRAPGCSADYQFSSLFSTLLIILGVIRALMQDRCSRKNPPVPGACPTSISRPFGSFLGWFPGLKPAEFDCPFGEKTVPTTLPT